MKLYAAFARLLWVMVFRGVWIGWVIVMGLALMFVVVRVPSRRLVDYAEVGRRLGIT